MAKMRSGNDGVSALVGLSVEERTLRSDPARTAPSVVSVDDGCIVGAALDIVAVPSAFYDRLCPPAVDSFCWLIICGCGPALA